MKNRKLQKYYIISLIAIVCASSYPIYMGVSILKDMLRDGTVMKENYPKYVIPYTPISIALLVGVVLLPLFLKLKKLCLPAGIGSSLSVFFIFEFLLEKCVTVTSQGISNLESWQMYMCYVPPEYNEVKTLTPVDILIGNYSPAFKLHFYLISVILIATMINIIYGFAKIIVTNDKTHIATLTLQAVSSAIFLILCIVACFTAFWRSGDILVSPLSAFMMSLFFIIMGVSTGIFTGSLIKSKHSLLKIALPSITASIICAAMYYGETILLNGYLYRYGSGFLFDPVFLSLAPIDILIIILSGAVTAIIFLLLNKFQRIK